MMEDDGGQKVEVDIRCIDHMMMILELLSSIQQCQETLNELRGPKETPSKPRNKKRTREANNSRDPEEPAAKRPNVTNNTPISQNKIDSDPSSPSTPSDNSNIVAEPENEAKSKPDVTGESEDVDKTALELALDSEAMLTWEPETSIEEDSFDTDASNSEDSLSSSQQLSARPPSNRTRTSSHNTLNFEDMSVASKAFNALRHSVPGLKLNPHKEKVVERLYEIDQLIINSRLSTGILSAGRTSPPLADEQGFSNFFQRASVSSRSVMNYFHHLLPERVQKSLLNTLDEMNIDNLDGKSLSSLHWYFCREGTSFYKPYLTVPMRDKWETFLKHRFSHKPPKLTTFGDKISSSDANVSVTTLFGLTDGDVLHVPMSSKEVEIILSNLPLTHDKLPYLCSSLPGRSVIDILRYLEDLRIYGPEANSSSTTIAYKSEEKKSVSTFQLNVRRQLDGKLHDTSRKFQLSCSRAMFKQIVPKGKARIQVEPIVDVQLDPTGNTRRVLVGTAQSELGKYYRSVLYDLDKGIARGFDEHEETVAASLFSNDGKHLIIASGEDVLVRWAESGDIYHRLGWDPDPTRADPRFAGHEETILLAFTSEQHANWLGTFSDTQIIVWDYMNNSVICEPTKKYRIPYGSKILYNTFSTIYRLPNLLFVGTERDEREGKLMVHEISESGCVNCLGETLLGAGVSSIASCWSRPLVAAAAGETLAVFDLRERINTRSPARVLATGQKDVNVVSFSPNEQFLQSSATNNECVVFDMRGGSSNNPLFILRHDLPYGATQLDGSIGITAVKWRNCSDFLITGGEDGHVRVWDIASNGSLVRVLTEDRIGGAYICSIDMSPWADLVVVGDESGTVSLYAHEDSTYILSEKIVRPDNPE